jgi:hypothetical protein
MSTKLTITIDDERLLLGLKEHDVHTVLMDALYEFVSHRGPNAEAYVTKRYADVAAYASEERRAAKIEQVRRRCAVAEMLLDSVTSLEVEKVAAPLLDDADLAAAMCRESTAGWDGRPDGPDRCTCDNSKPVKGNEGYCANCDGWLPRDEDVEDQVADAAQFRDEQLDK